MIYSNDPTKREIRRRTGRTGYFDEDWHGFSGDIVDTITGKMENYSELLRKKTDTWATMSKGQLDERVATFQDFGLTNMREGYVDRRLNEASNLRESATGDLDFSVPATQVTNLGQAQANRNRRVQGYLTAKRKLRSAQDLTAETGSSFKYNKTGYERLNPDIDSYYTEFDQMIDLSFAARRWNDSSSRDLLLPVFVTVVLPVFGALRHRYFDSGPNPG